jgi:hypothetical protein
LGEAIYELPSMQAALLRKQEAMKSKPAGAPATKIKVNAFEFANCAMIDGR